MWAAHKRRSAFLARNLEPKFTHSNLWKLLFLSFIQYHYKNVFKVHVLCGHSTMYLYYLVNSSTIFRVRMNIYRHELYFCKNSFIVSKLSKMLHYFFPVEYLWVCLSSYETSSLFETQASSLNTSSSNDLAYVSNRLSQDMRNRSYDNTQNILNMCIVFLSNFQTIKLSINFNNFFFFSYEGRPKMF